MSPDSTPHSQVDETATALQIGVASINTTPPEPVWLHGYGNQIRRQPFTGKLHDLEATAIALEDANGERAVLIGMDLCVLRKREATEIRERLAEATGLSPERLLVNLSHTHSGPMVSVEDVLRYPVSPEMQARINAYLEVLIERLIEVAQRAMADLQPGRLCWGRGEISFARNRRRFDEQGHYAGMGANPDGDCDPRVTVWRVETPDGKPRALAFHLSCHPVTLGPQNLQLCGDFVGFAKDAIRAQQPELVPMFIQGCCADINSEPRSTKDQLEQCQQQGDELAAEVMQVASAPMQEIHGPLSCTMSWQDLPLRQRPREQLEEEATAGEAAAHNPKRLLAMLERGETPPTSYRAPLYLWQFGNLTLAAISGEVPLQYLRRLEDLLAPQPNLVLGYTGEVYGYLPSARIVAEGGYEDRGLIREVGQFAASVEDQIIDAYRKLLAP